MARKTRFSFKMHSLFIRLFNTCTPLFFSFTYLLFFNLGLDNILSTLILIIYCNVMYICMHVCMYIPIIFRMHKSKNLKSSKVSLANMCTPHYLMYLRLCYTITELSKQQSVKNLRNFILRNLKKNINVFTLYS